MSKKLKATKTINPLHFEDLEPHRFEDLVRRLLYSFRDWQSIEPTGRGGSDDGFDVRAWEKGESVTNVDDQGEEGAHTLAGRRWQIQGKREKAINPAKMRKLIREGVDGAKPPYGYVLAAATNISKTAYDVFREELKKKGVAEFHFWGKDHLEDQLSLPDNDEILFTFFGLSLSPRRRARTTELKFNINNKNKILKLIFGSERSFNQGIPPGKAFLLRDIKAEHYPDQREYPDFNTYRRWEEHDPAEVTPKGIIFKFREWYACCDQSKKQWDFSKAVDLTPRKHNIDHANQARLEEEGKKVESYWRHLPRRLQAKLLMYGFVPFEDMLIIDDKGDTEYADPHIFVDFGPNGPFRYQFGNLSQHGTIIHHQELLADFKRTKVFPAVFSESAEREIHEHQALKLNADVLSDVEHVRGPATLYSFDDNLEFLTESSLIHIPKKDRESIEKYLEVTHVYKTTVGSLVTEKESEHYRSQLERSAGREIMDMDQVTVYEIHEVILPYGGTYLTYADHSFGW